MRGRHRNAAPDRKVSTAQRAGSIRHSPIGEAAIRASVSEGPSASPQVT